MGGVYGELGGRLMSSWGLSNPVPVPLMPGVQWVMALLYPAPSTGLSAYPIPY